PRARAGRVDRHLGRLAVAPHALARLPPRLEARAPLLRLPGGVVADAQALALRLARVDPRLEVGGRQVGEGEGEVAQVALGVDGQDGDAVDGRLLDQAHAEAGLAAAGHAHDDGVGGEVAGVVQ